MVTLDPESNEAVAERLKLLREATGYTTAASFAAFLGLSRQRWGNFEVATPLSKDVAMILVRKIPGVSLDWLYRGRPEGLSVGMADKLAGSARPPVKARKGG